MHIASPIPHKKARIEIIPLIDIMFFLLASFMMVSLSQVHMKGIKVNLPSGVSGQTQTKREYISVSVDKDGHYFFDKDEVKALFYRPPPRWYFWTALGAALAIHLTAVAVSQRHEARAVELPPQPPQVVEAVLAPPEATPPPEDIPIPEPPPPPEVQPEFVEERTPPPKQQQTNQKFV